MGRDSMPHACRLEENRRCELLRPYPRWVANSGGSRCRNARRTVIVAEAECSAARKTTRPMVWIGSALERLRRRLGLERHRRERIEQKAVLAALDQPAQ